MHASIAANDRAAALGEMSFYEVQPGDTLASVARRFGVSAQEVARANGLGPTAAVRPGDQLQVNGL